MKPKLLFILNEGRYRALAPILNRLLAEGTIADWQGVSVVPPAKVKPLVKPEDAGRVHFYQDMPNPFATFAEAQDYFLEVGRGDPRFDMGHVISAEKYMTRHFPGGLLDMAHAHRSLSALREKYGLDMVFSDYPSGSLDMMGYFLFRHAGGRVFYFTSSRMGVNVLYIDSLEGPKADVREGYARFLAEGVPEAERAEARAYLEDFHAHKRKPYYFQNAGQPVSLFERARKAWKAGAWRDPRAAWARVRARRRMAALQARVPYSRVDPGDRIVFHPMQYMPEASTYVRSPLYRDHVSVANLIALSLPAGYTLYVKDHPNLKQARDAAFYRQLLQFPNVKLVPYTTDTHAIIGAAKLVVTQSSTAGFESLLYGVPVLLLGEADIIYQDFKGVLKIGKRPMKEAIARAMAQPPITDEDKLPMILSIRKAGYPGKMDDPRWDPEVISPRNQENLYRFFKAKLDALR